MVPIVLYTNVINNYYYHNIELLLTYKSITSINVHNMHNVMNVGF